LTVDDFLKMKEDEKEKLKKDQVEDELF